jgi:hypothetical protein
VKSSARQQLFLGKKFPYRKASSMIFGVAGVRFADGDQWKPTHAAVLRAAQAPAPSRAAQYVLSTEYKQPPLIDALLMSGNRLFE